MPFRDEPIEGIAPIHGEARGDQRVGDVWTSDCPPAARRDAPQQLLAVERHAQLRQSRDHRLDTAATVVPLRAEELDERRMGGVEEVAEDMDVAGLLDRGAATMPGRLGAHAQDAPAAGGQDLEIEVVELGAELLARCAAPPRLSCR